MSSSSVVLEKGAYSVTIQSSLVDDSFKNKLLVITPPTGKQTQDAGPKTNKIVDLLRITRNWRVQGYITSNSEKSDLVNIIKGAGTKGGAITFTYANGGDTNSFNVSVESCIISEKASDEPSSPPSDFAKFSVNLTLIEGTSPGSS